MQISFLSKIQNKIQNNKSETGQRSTMLQHVYVPISSKKQCAKAYSELWQEFQNAEQAERQKNSKNDNENENDEVQKSQHAGIEEIGVTFLPVIDVDKDMICAGWPKGGRDACQVLMDVLNIDHSESLKPF